MHLVFFFYFLLFLSFFYLFSARWGGMCKQKEMRKMNLRMDKGRLKNEGRMKKGIDYLCSFFKVIMKNTTMQGFVFVFVFIINEFNKLKWIMHRHFKNCQWEGSTQIGTLIVLWYTLLASALKASVHFKNQSNC